MNSSDFQIAVDHFFHMVGRTDKGGASDQCGDLIASHPPCEYERCVSADGEAGEHDPVHRSNRSEGEGHRQRQDALADGL